jgi:uncharacterized protein
VALSECNPSQAWAAGFGSVSPAQATRPEGFFSARLPVRLITPVSARARQANVYYAADVTTEQIIGLVVTLLIMGVGAVGTIVPVLPGTPIILVAAVAHRLYFGEASANLFVLLVLLFLTVLSYVLEYAAQILGAKKLGATWKGAVGAVIGGLVGLFFSIPGILLGPFIGATLFELLGGRAVKPAARAGVGAVIGLLIGTAGKIAIAVAMVMLFTVTVMYKS